MEAYWNCNGRGFVGSLHWTRVNELWTTSFLSSAWDCRGRRCLDCLVCRSYYSFFGLYCTVCFKGTLSDEESVEIEVVLVIMACFHYRCTTPIYSGRGAFLGGDDYEKI